MAVYTHLDFAEIAEFLSAYDIGTPAGFEPILQGIDNTNYKIMADQDGRVTPYILTIFESRIDPDDLPFFMGFMAHCRDHELNCPAPIAGKNGEHIAQLHRKAAAIFPFLDGHNIDPMDITPDICAQLGKKCAQLHEAGRSFKLYRSNSMGMEAWAARLQKLQSQPDAHFQDLASNYLNELKLLRAQWPQFATSQDTGLPVGAVHADLFPDNVFQLNGQISGIIDFYFTATDFLAYDLAIVLNAWCFDADHQFVPDRWDLLLNHYQSVRPLRDDEKHAFQALAKGAALRFLSSRLHDLCFHDANALVTPKDPAEYIKKFEFHRHHALF